MRTRAELEQIVADPRAQQMLGYIRATEGTTEHGYNTAFGGKRFDDLSQHPNIRGAFKQTDGKQKTSNAAGAYQFMGDTWSRLAPKYELKDFGPLNQDIGALALIDEKGALDDVLAGDYKSAIDKTGGVWASFPSSTYKQPKKSWDFTNQYFAAQGGGMTPAAARTQEDARTAKSFDPTNAQDIVAGAMAGFSAPNPQVTGQNAFLALRKEQLKGEADRLALASIDHEANLHRTNAVRNFFGEDPVAMTPQKLHPAFEDALQEAMLQGT